MSNIAAGCKPPLAAMFWETFNGVRPGQDGTWFVQGGEALFDSIHAVSAEQASRRIEGQLSSIGAHVRHLRYYLSVFNANLRGESPDTDWGGSWKVQEFSETEWSELQSQLHADYEIAATWYESDRSEMDEERLTYAIANLAHAAYHLGAIRALMPIVLHRE